MEWHMIRAALTVEEALEGMKALEPKIKNYARLVVRKGVNVKPGQEVVVQSPVECAPFARVVVAEAYAAGAGHVTVIWADDAVTRLTYEHVDYNINSWCIAGAPVVAWAHEVFPGDADEVAIYKLWNAILHTARADGQDPESDWELHDAAFEKNLRFLNDNRFDYLHYTAANGTDLTIGMTKGHEWAGGKGKTPDGHPFFPNIPTEEVFTSPDRMRADGIVYSAMPLIHHGNKVDDFWIKFEGGRVVGYDARVGKATLASIIDTDEGAAHLGEVALISKNTPIRESGVLFYDTLYDENASCHLALGVGFPECIEGGYDMSKEELLEYGVNVSSTHVDFMIGTDDIDITGITPDGREVVIFQNGQWGWE